MEVVVSLVMTMLEEVATACADRTNQTHVWDRFLKFKCPGAHIEQTSEWARVRQAYGWEPTLVCANRDSTMIGGAMVLTRRVAGLATIGYVERGPVWDPAEPGAKRAVTEALCDFAQSKLAYLVIVPPYEEDGLVSLLDERKFRVKPTHFPPTGVGTATLLIDLQQDVDTLLAGMSIAKRQNIRRGIRKGVRVRLGGARDAETMRMLVWSACSRRGIRPSPPQRNYYDMMWRELGTTRKLKFFIAEIEGEPVSAACVLLSGPSMQLWRVGWSGKYLRHNPNDVLHWEMMRWGKENGYREFDFMHIPPEHARKILNGEKILDAYSGVTDFKTGFGGRLRLLPELYYRCFHPLLNLVRPAIDFPGLAKLCSRTHRAVRFR